uniref:Piwi domain-containing protein n=1 Tax=Corethron hystrix TaxID=216773 RepID=A0A6U5FXU4_9STRA|mmetsp:Transcript_24827/g.57172  ORF Transcript_24827/g.57172 Transcript_24827/m.57172 type:complete len:1044 (+) Transcript_24827:310-3441(+)
MSYYGGGGYDSRKRPGDHDHYDSRSRGGGGRDFGGGGGRDFGGGGGRYDGGSRGGGRYGDRGGRGGGRGRGGGGRGPRVARPQTLMVLANYFQYQIKPDLVIYRYSSHIYDAKRVKKKDKEGNVIVDADGRPEFELLVQTTKDDKKREVPEDKEATQTIRRRIFNKLQQELKEKVGRNACVAYDGGEIVYGNVPLAFDKSNEEIQAKVAESGHGIYGPSDPGGERGSASTNAVGKQQTIAKYFVRVKPTCDDDDEDQDRVKPKWFQVLLVEKESIKVTDVLRDRNSPLNKFDELRQCLDVINKTTLTKSLTCFGKSPRQFYFPEEDQENICGRAFAYYWNARNRKNHAPFLGITESTRICSRGNVYTMSDVCLKYLYRSCLYKPNRQCSADRSPPSKPIAVLNEEARTIAGVPIRDFHSPVPFGDRERVRLAIQKLTMKVVYKKVFRDSVIQRMKEKGADDRTIERRRRQVRLNVRMKKDFSKANEEKFDIKWAADDPADSFTQEPRRREGDTTEQENAPPPQVHTIASYFREQHGIQLKYPKMPIVCIGKGPFKAYEWYPIEFFFQSFGKMKNANEKDQVTEVLKFYDEFSGTEIVKKIEGLSGHNILRDQKEFLKLFGLARQESAKKLEAKILEEPSLRFCEQQSTINDGSWNLMRVKFDRPATMASFGIIDFTDRSGGKRFFSNILRVCKSHGMELPTNISGRDEGIVTERVAVNGHADNIGQCFENAIAKAKDFFWYDSSSFFRQNKVWHKTRVFHNNQWKDALLIPPPDNRQGEVGLILKNEPTHNITIKGVQQQARLMIGTTNRKQERKLVDPFDFFYIGSRGIHEAIISRNEREEVREEVEFNTEVYELEDGSCVTEVEQIVPCYISSEKVIEPISMIFTFLRDEDKSNYLQVKKMAHVTCGVPNQCVVKFPKFEHRPDQYCSNLAVKINTKLMNASNNARAWKTQKANSDPNSSGIPWLMETPTVVFGFSISHGLGQDSKSVIAGHVGLDAGCMQFASTVAVQSKSDVISNEIMKDMTKVFLYQQCCVEILQYPR